MKLLRGSFSCISLIMGVGLVAFRDPNGIRPLVLGRRESEQVGPSDSTSVSHMLETLAMSCIIVGTQGDEWAVASEDCAFGPIGFERVRDVRPGEMIIISPEGELQSRQVVRLLLPFCMHFRFSFPFNFSFETCAGTQCAAAAMHL